MPKVKLNGTELFYCDEGPHDAPAIVLSPLLYMDTFVYRPFMQAFMDEYRVICYDHRGQGESARSAKRFDIQTSTKDAIALIEYLNIEPCHFFGNCLGGYIGLNLAIQRSDLLKSCTLIGVSAEANSVKEIKELDSNLDNMKRFGAKSGLQQFAAMAFGPSFRASRDPAVIERREKLLQHFANLTADELETARQVYHHQNISREELQKISVPVLIIAGDEDQPNNVAAYKRMGQIIPHVNYKTVHDAGYAVSIEQPQEVINLLRDHIEKAERSFTAAQNSLIKSKSKASRARN